jgi:hypothetical protein
MPRLRQVVTETTGHYCLDSDLEVVEVPLPEHQERLHPEELVYSRALHSMLVPVAAGGSLDIVDIKTFQVSTFRPPFTAKEAAAAVSLAEGGEVIVVATALPRQLLVISTRSQSLVSRATLSSDPYRVRYVESRQEIWVTEPDAGQIEIFSLNSLVTSRPVRAATITGIPGVAALVVDEKRGRAYANIRSSKTVSIDLRSRLVTTGFVTACPDVSALALDVDCGVLYVSCFNGQLSARDLRRGYDLLSSTDTSKLNLQYGGPFPELDSIAYDAVFGLLAEPIGPAGVIQLWRISSPGKFPGAFSATSTGVGAHAVVIDELHQIWTADGQRNALVVFRHRGLPLPG